MDSIDSCLVLLGTYNGERFLQEQIESILGSQNVTAAIMIRDDSSTDETKKLLMALIEHCELIEYGALNLGHRGNFRALVHEAIETNFKYYSFSDQDDVWHVDKQYKLIKACKNAELHSNSKAVLSHCDLRVVDSELNVISQSFHKYQGLPTSENYNIKTLLHRNIVTGCTTLFNRELLEIVHPIPSYITVHDHWLALCAEYFGVRVFVNESLIDYRQHNNNAIGAISKKEMFNFLNVKFLKLLIQFPRFLSQSVEQACALENRRVERSLPVSEDKKIQVKNFASLKKLSCYKRVILGIKYFNTYNRLQKFYIILVLVFLPIIPTRK